MKIIFPLKDFHIIKGFVLEVNKLEKVLFLHPAYFIALGFGSGLSKFAPGTVGTLWSWAIFLIISNFFILDYFFIFLFFSFFVGIWTSEITSKKLNNDDPSAIVIDEIVAFWIVLAFLPSINEPLGESVLNGIPEWGIQLFAFAIFRFFDILKPPPINFIEKKVSGGFGIMIDDLVAAALTLLTISISLKFITFLKTSFL